MTNGRATGESHRQALVIVLLGLIELAQAIGETDIAAELATVAARATFRSSPRVESPSAPASAPAAGKP